MQNDVNWMLTCFIHEKEKWTLKLIRKLVTGLMILLVALGSSPLEVFANVTYNPKTEFPDQTKREWPIKNKNNVASDLPEPPGKKNTVDMSHIFHYPELIYTGKEDYDGDYWETISDRPWETKRLANNRAYVTDIDSSVAVITRDARWQSGVMWSNEQNKIVLSERFHMVAYVYLGKRTQHDRDYFENGDVRLGGADGITFTMHNDNKQPGDVTVRANDENTGEVKYKLASGSFKNTGMNAYGALGNGLGVYGSNFSANIDTDYNNMVDFWRGVENGITLEFDTFFNDNDTTQHSDNDLTSTINKLPPVENPENHVNTKYGHIAINLLNDFKNNKANQNWDPDKTKNKHKVKLSLGWDGELSKDDKTNPHTWVNPPKWPDTNLADGEWHRLEVEWTPDLETNTGNLNYKIYKQGHDGERNISDIKDFRFDGDKFIDYTVAIGSPDPTDAYSLQNVFGVENLNNSVYWGFSGSTGGFMNNQAVQMLQLPVNYYTAELSKFYQENQEKKSVSGAQFQIERKDENGGWIVQQFYDPATSSYVDTLETGSQEEGIEEEVYKGVSQSLGKIKLTQLTAGTYRWKEVAPPEGYQKNPDQEYYPSENGFVVNYQNRTVTTEAENTKLYQLELTKTDSDTQQPLNDVPFIISKTENDKQYYLKLNAETTTGFEWTEFEEEAEKFFSGKSYALDENGQISGQDGDAGKLIVKYFPDAPNLSWKEVEVPKGYDSSGTLTGYFTPSTDGYVYSATQTNKPKDFVLTLEKLSSTFQEPLPLKGVVFELYDSDDSAGEPDFSTLEPKDTVTTDADGKIVLNKGQIQADKTYYLVESQTVGGFIQLKGYFTITTSKVEGINDVTYVKADSETDLSPFEFTSTSTDTSFAGTLKIYNKKLILPATGGNGILGYVGIGLTMTIVALLFFIARKRIFKWSIILIVATSGLAGLAGGTQVVSAQEQEQVQLEVNRLVYQPSDTQYKSGVPVAGAKLEVVDVTKSFYELVNRQKLSLKEAQEAVSKSNKIDGQSLAVATTDQSGLVRFTVSKTSQQRPAVYLIRELVTPVAVTKMENMVVVLPILDESGNEKTFLSLFPKSHGTFSFDKTIDEKQSSYSFGEPIPYRLSTIIPQDMTNLSSYEIEDIYDQGLRFISESLEIFIDGEKQSDSIKAVSLSENQFRVVFDVAKLADFSGKKLEVTYQMVIKDEAAIDQDLVNTATLYPGDLTPLVDRENVQTGGFRFIKRAAEGKQNHLAKATFVIKNPTDDTVLTYKEGKYQFEKVATNESGVVRLTSDDDGYFEIRGLGYGEYLVSEIRAPTGYVLQDKPTAFTVGVSTYSQGPVLSIFNVKKPKIRLPQTGTVVTSTAFVGWLLMASSLLMVRRRKK